jgi:hypothetical protein
LPTLQSKKQKEPHQKNEAPKSAQNQRHPPTTTPYYNTEPSQPLGKIGISFNLVFMLGASD